MNYQYVSIFSGAGGLDIGLERAGLEAAAMCEIEKTFCQTLEENRGWRHSDGRKYFRKTKIINADIRKLSRKDLLFSGKLALLVGGPPCQAFSSSGKQLSILDPRGALVSEFYRLVKELRPRMFLFENVRGLVTARDKHGEPGGVIVQLMQILEGIGYSCRAGLLNSADYGAHQRRVRCFILGSSKGEAPNFPEPMFHRSIGLFDCPWRSLREFLGAHADEEESSFTYPSKSLFSVLKDIQNGFGVKSPGRAEATRPNGHWGYRQGTFIADLNLPARTVTGSSSQDWIRWNGKLRRLTFEEVKLLQGFPKDWIVCGTKAKRFQQIGNAVHTVFGETLGQVIVSHLKNFPISNPVRIGLPKNFLGYMDYTKRDHLRNKEARTVHRHFEKKVSSSGPKTCSY